MQHGHDQLHEDLGAALQHSHPHLDAVNNPLSQAIREQMPNTHLYNGHVRAGRMYEEAAHALNEQHQPAEGDHAAYHEHAEAFNELQQHAQHHDDMAQRALPGAQAEAGKDQELFEKHLPELSNPQPVAAAPAPESKPEPAPAPAPAPKTAAPAPVKPVAPAPAKPAAAPVKAQDVAAHDAALASHVERMNNVGAQLQAAQHAGARTQVHSLQVQHDQLSAEHARLQTENDKLHMAQGAGEKPSTRAGGYRTSGRDQAEMAAANNTEAHRTSLYNKLTATARGFQGIQPGPSAQRANLSSQRRQLEDALMAHHQAHPEPMASLQNRHAAATTDLQNAQRALEDHQDNEDEAKSPRARGGYDHIQGGKDWDEKLGRHETTVDQAKQNVSLMNRLIAAHPDNAAKPETASTAKPEPAPTPSAAKPQAGTLTAAQVAEHTAGHQAAGAGSWATGLSPAQHTAALAHAKPLAEHYGAIAQARGEVNPNHGPAHDWAAAVDRHTAGANAPEPQTQAPEAAAPDNSPEARYQKAKTLIASGQRHNMAAWNAIGMDAIEAGRHRDRYAKEEESGTAAAKPAASAPPPASAAPAASAPAPGPATAAPATPPKSVKPATFPRVAKPAAATAAPAATPPAWDGTIDNAGTPVAGASAKPAPAPASAPAKPTPAASPVSDRDRLAAHRKVVQGGQFATTPEAFSPGDSVRSEEGTATPSLQYRQPGSDAPVRFHGRTVPRPAGVNPKDAPGYEQALGDLHREVSQFGQGGVHHLNYEGGDSYRMTAAPTGHAAGDLGDQSAWNAGKEVGRHYVAGKNIADPEAQKKQILHEGLKALLHHAGVPRQDLEGHRYAEMLMHDRNPQRYTGNESGSEMLKKTERSLRFWANEHQQRGDQNVSWRRMAAHADQIAEHNAHLRRSA